MLKRLKATACLLRSIRVGGLLWDGKGNPYLVCPHPTPSRWVDCSGMAKRATDVVRTGALKIMPKEHEKTWCGPPNEVGEG